MSLSENLHNLGTLLKTNLETKGINGLTGNEGLTTLANKILDIEGSSSSSKSVVAHITGNNVTIGKRNSTWLIANDATINWGDGTSNTVDNPQETLSHTYTDGVNEHLIALDGTITGLGIDCFYGCTGLTSIFIPNSITSIGARCFIDCSGLTSVVIPNSVTSLGTSCFRECSSLINVIIPNSITSLGNNCFDGCSSLTNVVIPNSITSLGTSCFDGCSSLNSIIIPNSVTSLGTSCFKWCSGLTSVIIPNSISSLGLNCFAQCSSLTSVVIPNSVTSLGDQCFFECSGLTSVTIPSSVTSLGDWCFHNCDALIDYQLYWTGNNIITYDSSTMPNNTDTIFTIPVGETSNYTAKGYPASKLVERGPQTLTLTCDKPIIQKTETSTVTATLKQSGSPLSGKTLNYFVTHDNNGVLNILDNGSVVTNSNGEASITYTGTGVGDVSVEVTYGTLLQETFIIQDCKQYNNGSTVNGLNIGSGVSCTSNGDYITITTSTSGEKYIYLTNQLTSSDEWVFETEVAETGVDSSLGLCLNDATWYGAISDSQNTIYVDFGRNQSITMPSTIKGGVYKVIRQNGTTTAYWNDTVIGSTTNSHKSSFKLGYYTNNGRVQHIKNIKLKAL